MALAIAIAYSVLQSRPIKKPHDTISAQMPLLHHSYLRDLLGGKFLSIEGKSVDALNFDLAGARYIVALISVKEHATSLEHLAKARMFVDSYALSSFGAQMFLP